MEGYHYEIVSDGGSKHNDPKRGKAYGYGSYRISAGDKSEIVRKKFGNGVPVNQAEYRAAIAALEDLVGRIKRAFHQPSEYTVRLRTDSRLLVDQMSGASGTRDKKLKVLKRRLVRLKMQFGKCDIEHMPREEVVEILGH